MYSILQQKGSQELLSCFCLLAEQVARLADRIPAHSESRDGPLPQRRKPSIPQLCDLDSRHLRRLEDVVRPLRRLFRIRLAISGDFPDRLSTIGVPANFSGLSPTVSRVPA
jgi:hypothetical protein